MLGAWILNDRHSILNICGSNVMLGASILNAEGSNLILALHGSSPLLLSQNIQSLDANVPIVQIHPQKIDS